MTKDEIMRNWKENLKNNNEKWNSYYEKLIQKFSQTKTWKEIKKNRTINNKYGKIFEYIVAFAMADMKVFGSNYVVQKESAYGKNPNDGVDLIVPINLKEKNELWFIQVKTGKKATMKISRELIKLEDRSEKILKDAQNIDIDAKKFSKRWHVSLKLANKIKEYNNWELKMFWVVDNNKKYSSKMNIKISPSSIEKLIIEKSPIKHPSIVKIKKDLIFKIEADFSISEHKAIINKNKELKVFKTIIAPLKISYLLSFLEQFFDKKNNIDPLFTLNVRDDKGKNNISQKILKTINDDEQPFFEMNNGIIALCKKIDYKKNGMNWEIFLKNVNIINGQQTIRTIWNERNNLSEKAKEKYILLQAYINDNDNKARLISSSSNTQSAVSASEIISTYSFNFSLHKELLKRGLFYSYRKGKTKYSEQFIALPKITIGNILKYANIKFDENVWAKNNINKVMNEIAFGDPKDTSISKVAQFVKNKNDNEINEEFKTIASLISYASQLKNQLAKSQSFDIFASLFMKDEKKAEKFIKKFNKEVENFIKRKEKENNIPGDNIANIFKTKKHSNDFYEQIKQKFNEYCQQ